MYTSHWLYSYVWDIQIYNNHRAYSGKKITGGTVVACWQGTFNLRHVECSIFYIYIIILCGYISIILLLLGHVYVINIREDSFESKHSFSQKALVILNFFFILNNVKSLLKDITKNYIIFFYPLSLTYIFF